MDLQHLHHGAELFHVGGFRERLHLNASLPLRSGTFLWASVMTPNGTNEPPQRSPAPHESGRKEGGREGRKGKPQNCKKDGVGCGRVKWRAEI